MNGLDLVTMVLLVLLKASSAQTTLVLAVLVLGLQRTSGSRRFVTASSAHSFFAPWPPCWPVYLNLVELGKLWGAVSALSASILSFLPRRRGARSTHAAAAKAMLGLTAFWATVVKVELTDIVFAIDSILVAVAMSNKTWVILTGGILGIIAMRIVIGKLLTLVQQYPALVDGAFIIIAWVGIKLLMEFAHQQGWVHFEIPKWLALGLIVVIFGIAFLYARKHPHEEPEEEAAARDVDKLENDLL